jgi:hypothetical protein
MRNIHNNSARQLELHRAQNDLFAQRTKAFHHLDSRLDKADWERSLFDKLLGRKLVKDCPHVALARSHVTAIDESLKLLAQQLNGSYNNVLNHRQDQINHLEHKLKQSEEQTKALALRLSQDVIISDSKEPQDSKAATAGGSYVHG